MADGKLEIKTYGRGEVIFRQGEYQPCMYDILEGGVGIYAHYGDEEEKLLTELAPGAFFGEMGMIECYPRSADAVALEDNTRVQVITPEDFQTYFQENADKIFAIMRHMSGRIRSLTGDYLEVCRAAAEVAETAGSGREKSGWLKEHLKKFETAYTESMKAAVQFGFDHNAPMYFGGMHW